MIPHRTKLRELAIESWREDFMKLKADFLVRYIMSYLTYSHHVYRLRRGEFR